MIGLITSPAGAVAKYCNEPICLCICLSVREDISGTKRTTFTIFRSNLRQSRPNKAVLKCLSVVRTYVRVILHTIDLYLHAKFHWNRRKLRPYVRPSKNSFFDFNEIWHVGRGRWVMPDGMQYDLIHGQGQGHEPFKVGNTAVFKSYIIRHL